MLLPNNFKQKIANTFYDKTVNIIDITKTIDTDGGVIKQPGEIRDTFLGNVRFNAQKILENEIGVIIDADIIITCPTDTQISLNDTIRYSDVDYIVNNIIPSDSHLTVTGKICQ